MSEHLDSCVVCGARPTVKSHLFPRALVRRIRGDDKHVTQGDRVRLGVKLTQSGPWDDSILCDTHESLLGPFDDYIARFCSRFSESAVISSSGNSYNCPNPKPDLLLGFAYATIWRFAVSKHGAMHHLQLGPYQLLLEHHLFHGHRIELQAILGRANVVDPRGKSVEVGIAPYRVKLRDWNLWHFAVGGFDFYVKTDQRPFPRSWKPFLLNDNDPVAMPLIDPQALHDIPKFQSIFQNMIARRAQEFGEHDKNSGDRIPRLR